jgi:hypothetical protein
MHLLRSPEFAGVLCLSSLLVLFVQRNDAPDPEAVSFAHESTEILMREGGCSPSTFTSEPLAEIRGVLPLDCNISETRDVLEAVYGDAVTQTAAPLDYIWVKHNGEWYYVCIAGAEFEVDLGERGTVLISSREAMPSARL